MFLGPWAAQPLGDYASGSNHVLPTGGWARRRGGLSAADFVKCISVQSIDRQGFARLADDVQALARAEGLRRMPTPSRYADESSVCPCGRRFWTGAPTSPRRRPREQTAPGFQREHHGLLAGRDSRARETLAETTGDVSRIRSRNDGALARHFGVQPEELLLTNGGDDALRVFFDAFVDAGSTF